MIPSIRCPSTPLTLIKFLFGETKDLPLERACDKATELAAAATSAKEQAQEQASLAPMLSATAPSTAAAIAEARLQHAQVACLAAEIEQSEE